MARTLKCKRLTGQMYEMQELFGYDGEITVISWSTKDSLRVNFESQVASHHIGPETGYDHDVLEAAITDTRIALDWAEEGEPFHAVLHATAANTNYEGKYTSGSMKAVRHVAENGDELLVLNWIDESGDCGVAIIHLSRNWK